MISTELAALLAQYRAALDAQLAILRQLRELSVRERDGAHAHSPAELIDIVDARERVMAALVALESDIMPVRQALAAARHQLTSSETFHEVVALHRQAVELVEEVVRTDEQSRTALRQAERARRAAAESLERSESTLAAYRRVVLPEVAAATLVNRRG